MHSIKSQLLPPPGPNASIASPDTRTRAGNQIATRLRDLWCWSCLLGWALGAHAADLTVTSTADSGPGSLRQAIADAVPGNTIDFAISGTITVASDLTIDKGLIIAGPGATSLTIMGNGGNRLFNVTSGPTSISGLKLANGADWSETPGGGGAILNSAALTLISCELVNNQSTSAGGAVCSIGPSASFSAAGCAFENNEMSYSFWAGNYTLGGGAIYNDHLLYLTNCTFVGNSTGVEGGAVDNVGTAVILSSTVFGNMAHTGGGLFNGGTLRLQNSLLASNSNFSSFPGTPEEISGYFFSGDYNLIQATNGLAVPGTHNVLGQDPILARIRDFGGPTRTCALGHGSPAVDAADPATSPTTDQRGVARPVGAGYDIGAYEGELPPNHPPFATNSVAPVFAQYGDVVQFPFPFNCLADPDAGQDLSYSIVDPSGSFYFDPFTGMIYGTAFVIGTNTISLVATDDGAPSLSGSNTVDIVVSKRQVTVKANDLTRPFGFPEQPFSLTYFNLIGPASDIDVPPTLTTTATAASPPGTYPIVASGGSDDVYEFVGWTNGSLRVLDFSVDYQVVRSFGFTNRMIGSSPLPGLILGSDGSLYGMGQADDNSDYGNSQGTIFGLDTNGVGRVLHQFAGSPADGFATGTGFIDGGLCEGTNGILYGTTYAGGISNAGLIFKIERDGSGYAIIHQFTNAPGDGAFPASSLLQGSDGILYGTTSGGGFNQWGTVFKINPDGSGFAVIHDFGSVTNDGADPVARLFEASNGSLYGTTDEGGEDGFSGTVFTLKKDGSDYAILHNFSYFDDGSHPEAGLVEGDDHALYGTTRFGGGFTDGTIFKIGLDGTNFVQLMDFVSEGHFPVGALMIGSDHSLYGMTERGGVSGAGNIFSIHQDGSGFTDRYDFPDGGNGTYPESLVNGPGGKIYGVTSTSATTGRPGTAFAINEDGSDYSLLWAFQAGGSDGITPVAALIQARDGRLYGGSYNGGTNGGGTIFGLNLDGTGASVLQNFDAVSATDACHPNTELLEAGDRALYGMSYFNAFGKIYKVNTDGSGYGVLHHFALDGTGYAPLSALVPGSDGSLYSALSSGGVNYEGTLFKISTNGTGYGTVYDFGTMSGDGYGGGSLLAAGDGTIYGTTPASTIFKLQNNVFSLLHTYQGYPEAAAPSGLMLGSDGWLYGASAQGGEFGLGAIFRIQPDGSGYTNLCSLGQNTRSLSTATARLVEGPDHALYGSTDQGGLYGLGGIFRVNRDGSDFCVVHYFDTHLAVSYLGLGRAPLLLATNNALYGTTAAGGQYGLGTVFKVAVGPVENLPPVVTAPIPDFNSPYGASFGYVFPTNTFTDPDAGQILSYTAGRLPAGLQFDGALRSFSGTPTEAGTYTITVTATDNGTPPLSTNTTFQFAVAKAVLVVGADNKSRSYGQANPAFTGSLIGVTNGDNITASFITTATSSSAPGAYPITPVFNDPAGRLDNYMVTTNPGALNISCSGSIVVTTAADSGPGSFRQAILDANADPCTDDLTIRFNIAGGGVHTIAPLSGLPAITRPLTIDGYSQPGASPNTLASADNAVLLIELNGANAGASTTGLAIQSSNMTVRGLVINRFTADAVFVDGRTGASQCVIEGNFIGVDPSGAISLPNGWPGQGAIMLNASPGNRVGGMTPGARNLVSGNAYAGISIQGSTAVSNVIQGNFIGTDFSGTNSLSNTGGIGIDVESPFTLIGGTNASARNILADANAGLALYSDSNTVQGNFVGIAADGQGALGAPGNGIVVLGMANLVGGVSVGAGNVVSGHVGDGIRLIGSSNIVQGNFIGTDATGTLNRGNHIEGLGVFSSGNLIGGPMAGARNVIAGSPVGIEVNGSDAIENVIQGNFVGTDATGTNALPNLTGISLDAPLNVLGGTQPGAGNVISGNIGFGVGISTAGTSNTVVQGNYFGLGPDGVTPVPNMAGLRINGNTGNLIGGTAAGAGNWFAHNATFGITVIGTGATNNSFLGNHIFANGTLGIDLGEDGLTQNDPGDGDDGQNHLQNSPEITSATVAAGQMNLRYRVDSTEANAAYPLMVECFMADTNGAGKIFIHRDSYTTPQTFANITFSPAATVNAGDPLVATATDANGNTSEFSSVATVAVNHRPQVANPVPDQGSVYGSIFAYSFQSNTFSDPDAGDSLTYTATNLPPGITFDGPTRTFAGTNADVGAFLVTITATDNGTPPLATNAMFNLVVAKALITARVLDQTNSYGGFIFVNSYVTVDYSGFKFDDENLYGLDSLPAISTSATSSSPVGTYPIHLSGGADRHYDFVLQDGTMKIVPVPLTVVTYNVHRLMGQTNPPLSGRLVGILNSDQITASFSTTATTASPVGNYPISVALADPNHQLSNYTPTYLSGELVILPYDFVLDVVHPFGTNADDIAYGPGSAVLEGPDGVLYGITQYGGGSGRGSIYRVNKDGTGYQILASLPAPNYYSGEQASIIKGTNGLLYGVIAGDGQGGFAPGRIFSLDTNGLNFTTRHTFSDAEGGGPTGRLLLSTNGLLYGVGFTSIYQIAQDGAGLAVRWQDPVFGTGPWQIAAGMIEGSDGFLYGSSVGGGDFFAGTVFKFEKGGTAPTVLHSFSDGGEPLGLIEGSDGWLYGVTAAGGMFSEGSVFKLGRDGTGFEVLHHFDSVGGDGVAPIGGLVEGNDGYLYGSTERGGTSVGTWAGTVYRLQRDGSGYSVLHNFGGPSIEPGYLASALIHGSDGALYGTAEFGVTDNKGAVFRMVPLIPPTLGISTGPSTVTISWSPATPGFVLQQNASPGPLTWTNTPTGSTNPVTLHIGPGTHFFRLIH